MRKPRIIAPLALALVIALGAFGVTGCSAADEETATGDQTSGGEVILKVGASPTPHAEILKQVADELAAEGFKLKIIEYTDYVLPNTGVEAGEIDANYFQHTPYLEDFNAENGTTIVSAAKIHFEPLGLYAGKTSSIAALADGAKIAVPNDATNEARALLLLEQEGILTLKKDAGVKATVNDIVENPKNISFVEVEAAAVPAMLPDVDMAVINGNYALSAGLSITDAIASEASDGLAADTYANIIAVAAGHENDPGIKALIKVLTSDKIRTFIEQEYKGAVVPVF